MSASVAMLLAMAGPLVAAALVFLLGRWPNARDGAMVATAGATLAAVVALLLAFIGGESAQATFFMVLPGLPLAFQVEPLGMLFALVAGGLWMPTSIYAIGYMRGHHEKNQTRFFICFSLAIFGALGVAFSRNLFTLFLFYEFLTLSTYPLVTHHQTTAAKTAGRVYMGILLTTSVCFLLLAVVWTYVMTGTTEFTPGGILQGNVEDSVVPILLALFAFGTGKAALMPFHRWLPNAMVAPTPVSALLHAVAVVKAGVFTITKVVVYIFGLDLLTNLGASEWLTWVAGGTILVASTIALTKDNLKARLAYSTISQLSYIVLGAALATPAAIMAGALHIAVHALGKITLFFCAGSIYVVAHKSEISTMDGLAHRMPWTYFAFLVGSLAIIGVPPAVFLNKFYFFDGSVPGQSTMVLVLLVSSLLSIAYLMPVVARGVFLPAPADDHHDHHGDHADDHSNDPDHGPVSDLRAAPLMVVPLMLTALGCVVLTFFADRILDFLLPITQV